LGRFVTRGVQKHKRTFFFHEKDPSGLITKKCGFVSLRFFFSPSVVLFNFFYHVFGRFVTTGVLKRDLKKLRENLLSFQKKYLLTSLFFSFHGAPCQPTTSHIPDPGR
jgi:hypothetical protein